MNLSILKQRAMRSRVRTNRAPNSVTERFDQAGQATVEFAFAITFFILLFFGFIGLAIVFFSWLSVASAAREGARYTIANPSATDSQIKTYVCSTSVMLGGSSSACNSLLSSGGLVMTIEPTQSARISNAQVSVKVDFQVPVPTLSVPFLGGGRLTFLGPIWVSSVSVMRIE